MFFLFFLKECHPDRIGIRSGMKVVFSNWHHCRINVWSAIISRHFFFCSSGKGNRHAVLDSEVVLTKMKLFNNFQERLSIADDSNTSTISLCKRDSTETSKPLMESSSDFMSDIFPDSQLPRLYKFESEDSGVELPSGANSPSTPTGSEQSFVVHSRESSCDSCNLKSDPTILTDKLTTCAQTSVTEQAESSVDHITAQNTEDNAVQHSEELSSSDVKEELHKHELVDRDQCKASGVNLEARVLISGESEEGHNVTEELKIFKQRRQCGKQFTGDYDDMICDEIKSDPIRKSATSESLEEYMDQCCRLSEVRSAGLLQYTFTIRYNLW